MDFVQIFGYAASILVAISLTINNVYKLRIANGIGSLAFAIYAFIIGAYPVFAVNAWIFGVDVYYLIQMKKSRDSFTTLKTGCKETSFVTKFIEYYAKDIEKFFPDFNISKLSNPKIIFTLRNMMPVNLFVYEEKGENIDIAIDYTVPAYRDLKNACYLFSEGVDDFRKEGFKKFIANTDVPAHKGYLVKMGFKNTENTVYEKAI